MTTLSPDERSLVLEALATAASRHESMARTVKHGARHDRRAAAMRKLRFRIAALREGERLVLLHGAAFSLPEVSP